MVALQGLKPFAEDAAFREKWSAIKYHNKERFAGKVKEWTGIDIPVGAMYDIHIKRIHEYKRQYVINPPSSRLTHWACFSRFTRDVRLQIPPEMLKISSRCL